MKINFFTHKFFKYTFLTILCIGSSQKTDTGVGKILKLGALGAAVGMPIYLNYWFNVAVQGKDEVLRIVANHEIHESQRAALVRQCAYVFSGFPISEQFNWDRTRRFRELNPEDEANRAEIFEQGIPIINNQTHSYRGYMFSMCIFALLALKNGWFISEN